MEKLKSPSLNFFLHLLTQSILPSISGVPPCYMLLSPFCCVPVPLSLSSPLYSSRPFCQSPAPRSSSHTHLIVRHQHTPCKPCIYKHTIYIHVLHAHPPSVACRDHDWVDTIECHTFMTRARGRPTDTSDEGDSGMECDSGRWCTPRVARPS